MTENEMADIIYLLVFMWITTAALALFLEWRKRREVRPLKVELMVKFDPLNEEEE